MAPPYQHESHGKVESQPSSLHSSFFEPNSPCPTQDIDAKEVESDEDTPIPILARLDSVFAMNKMDDTNLQFENGSTSFAVGNSWMLENIDNNRGSNEEEPLPQLNEQQSLFTYYLSQSLS